MVVKLIMQSTSILLDLSSLYSFCHLTYPTSRFVLSHEKENKTVYGTFLDTDNKLFTVVSDNKLHVMSRLASSKDSHFLQELPEGSDLSYLDRGRIQKTKVAQKRKQSNMKLKQNRQLRD